MKDTSVLHHIDANFGTSFCEKILVADEQQQEDNDSEILGRELSFPIIQYKSKEIIDVINLLKFNYCYIKFNVVMKFQKTRSGGYLFIYFLNLTSKTTLFWKLAMKKILGQWKDFWTGIVNLLNQKKSCKRALLDTKLLKMDSFQMFWLNFQSHVMIHLKSHLT